MNSCKGSTKERRCSAALKMIDDGEHCVAGRTKGFCVNWAKPVQLTEEERKMVARRVFRAYSKRAVHLEVTTDSDVAMLDPELSRWNKILGRFQHARSDITHNGRIY